jgi:hypothetical protein
MGYIKYTYASKGDLISLQPLLSPKPNINKGTK